MSGTISAGNKSPLLESTLPGPLLAGTMAPPAQDARFHTTQCFLPPLSQASRAWVRLTTPIYLLINSHSRQSPGVGDGDALANYIGHHHTYACAYITTLLM